MIEVSPTETLSIRLGGAPATTAPNFYASYFDSDPTDGVTAKGDVPPTPTNGTTPVPVLTPPPAGQTRSLSSFYMVNIDTAPLTASLTMGIGAVYRVTLSAGDILEYEKNGEGWKVTTSSGARKFVVTPYSTSGVMTMLNVMDYGATGDGTTSDQIAIQSAINAASLGHGGRGVDVFFPQGVYRTTATLTCTTSNVRLIGAGRGSTVIYPDFTVGDVLQFGNGTSVVAEQGFMHMQIFAPAQHTSGAGVKVNYSSDFQMDDFALTNMATGIQIGNGVNPSLKVYISNGTIDSCQATTGVCILVLNGLGGDTYITDIVSSNAAGSKPAAGVRVTQSGHCRIWGCNFTSCVKGLDVNPGAGQDVNYLFIDDSLFDSGATHGASFAPTDATGRIRSVKCTNSWFSGSGTTYGIEIGGVAGSVVDDLEFVNGRVLNNSQHGVYISNASAQNIRFLGGTIAGNGQAAGNTYDGINSVANVNKVSVVGVTIGTAGTATNTQRYAINVPAGTSAEWMITANICSSNGTVPYINFGGTGTGNKILGNDPQTSGMGAVATLPAPVATSGATETLILKAAIQANSVKVGDTFEVMCQGISSSTGTLSFKVRAGANGTIADNLAWTSITSAAQVANQRSGFWAMLVVRSIGAGGTIECEGLGNAHAALLPSVVAPVATAAVATTAPWYIDIACTCSVGTWTAQQAVVSAC